MTACCKHLCELGITKIAPSSTPELSKLPSPQKSYTASSLATPKLSRKAGRNASNPLQNWDDKRQRSSRPETSTTPIVPRRKKLRTDFHCFANYGHYPHRRVLFKKFSVSIDFRHNLFLFQDLSLRLKPHIRVFRYRMFKLQPLQKIKSPIVQVIVPTNAATEIENFFGILEATHAFYQKSPLNVTPAKNQLQAGRTITQVTNMKAHTFTISPGTVVTDLKKLSPGQASHVRSMLLEQPALVSLHPDEPNNSIIQLFETAKSPVDKRRYPRDFRGVSDDQPDRTTGLWQQSATLWFRETGPDIGWRTSQSLARSVQLNTFAANISRTL